MQISGVDRGKLSPIVLLLLGKCFYELCTTKWEGSTKWKITTFQMADNEKRITNYIYQHTLSINFVQGFFIVRLLAILAAAIASQLNYPHKIFVEVLSKG